MWILFLACTDPEQTPLGSTPDSPTSEPPAPTEATMEVALSPAPLREAPLGQHLEITASEPVTVTVTATDPKGTFTWGPFAEAPTLDVWLHHWHTGVTATVDVQAVTATGATLTWSGEVTTEPLPTDMPTLVVQVAEPDRMEPGVTFLAPTGGGPDAPSYLVALDALGEVVWYYAGSGAIHQIEQLPDGSIRFMRNRDGLFVIDLRGGLIAEYHPENAGLPGIQVPVERLHHDMIPGPDGSILSLSIDGELIEDYPLDELTPTSTGETLVAGDVIVEFDAATGELRQSWALLDLLDTHRIGWDAVFGDYWVDYFGRNVADWSHGNALLYDAENDRIWYSSRHQDAIVALDRATGTVEGILSNPDHWSEPWASLVWTQVGEGMLPYHQHGIQFGPGGTLLVFDNGNARTSPPEVPTVETTSRASEWAIDFAAGTMEEVWAYDDPRGLFSSSLGNTLYLPQTGNILVDYGNLKRNEEADPGALILEVTHTEPAEVVFELAVFPLELTLGNATAYRAYRWATLQPVPGR